MEDKPSRDLKGRFIKGQHYNRETEFKKGRKVSEEELRRLRSMRHTEETKRKISTAQINEKHNLWKGDNVGYDALHTWVRRHWPVPDNCQMCDAKRSKNKRLVLANITGTYKRDFHNWKYICDKCHNYLDGTVYNLIHMKRND